MGYKIRENSKAIIFNTERHLNPMYPTYRGTAYILYVQEVQQLLLVMVSQIGSLSAMDVGLVKAPRIDIS